MDERLPDDGFKWFGEGFDGFPKRLPDDCVEYIIHVIDEKLNSTWALRNRLKEILKAANALKKERLAGYIWQRDAFDLTVHPKVELDGDSTSKPYLRGRTNFGDSVADEWLIVYLLHELSKEFPDAWIRVYDTDGEFLLIEAANSLPKWLNPDIAEHRVWMNNGHLKIIPLSDDCTSRKLSLQAALKIIRTTPQKLLVEPAIEEEAFYRLREYPSAISSSLHHSLVTIPRRLAYILHRNPTSISPAIEAFYLRDTISLKPLSTKDLSTLYFPPEDFITVSVKFTKVGYAQLKSQVFDLPPAWIGILPKMKDEKIVMGMKLTCGFEMLVADPQSRDKRVVREIKMLLEDVESGEETLPSEADIKSWPQTQDDEKWLDIDYNEFEKELSGKGGSRGNSRNGGFGDQGAQENLRKMVDRFQDFVNDDEAGVEGVDDMEEDDDTESEASTKIDEDSKERAQPSEADEEEFRQAVKAAQSMPASQVEESGLLAEARRLALEDDEDASDVDEDEEMRKVMELMEKELKGHGALNLKPDGKPGRGKGKAAASDKQIEQFQKPFFGPEPPATMAKKNVRFNDADDDDDFVGPGDGELSSDDEEEYNDVNLDLAKNMLESFKGQAGMAGPAGNLMTALGVSMPRDEGHAEEEKD
ncbi:related to regulatory factor Sgt1 [Lecanosticta acicola]|uniref:Related to regulatory factor Sgt1 n=1 Tax=Lecanosticta acicola TaxID=111012 RepID=A0AAI8Z6Y6_9PEZI|nr:related to regulatory factor Sgt1 [Lecanosticta acicola]